MSRAMYSRPWRPATLQSLYSIKLTIKIDVSRYILIFRYDKYYETEGVMRRHTSMYVALKTGQRCE
jgi:hypothetical protein